MKKILLLLSAITHLSLSRRRRNQRRRDFARFRLARARDWRRQGRRHGAGEADRRSALRRCAAEFRRTLRNADVLIDGGAELELGWLPPLLQNARNPKIEVGKPGRVQASQGIRLMNVPANVTRAAGDVHALGNPHFMVDPIIAKGGRAAHRAIVFRSRSAERRILRSELQEVRGDDQCEAPGMGHRHAAVQRATRRRLSRFVALFRAPFRFEHRYLPRAEAGHSAVAFASRGSDRADESAEDQGDHRRAFHDRRIAEKVASRPAPRWWILRNSRAVCPARTPT